MDPLQDCLVIRMSRRFGDEVLCSYNRPVVHPGFEEKIIQSLTTKDTPPRPLQEMGMTIIVRVLVLSDKNSRLNGLFVYLVQNSLVFTQALYSNHQAYNI